MTPCPHDATAPPPARKAGPPQPAAPAATPPALPPPAGPPPRAPLMQRLQPWVDLIAKLLTALAAGLAIWKGLG